MKKMWAILFLMIFTINFECAAGKHKNKSVFEEFLEENDKAYKNFQKSRSMFDDICYPRDHSSDYLDFYDYFGCLRKSYEFIDLAFKNNMVHSSMIDTLQNTKPYSSAHICMEATYICEPLDSAKKHLKKKESFFDEKKRELSASVAKQEGYTKSNLREMWMRRAVMEKQAYQAMEDALDYLETKVKHAEAEHVYEICRFQLTHALETDNDNAYLIQAIKSLCKPFFEIHGEGEEEIIKHDEMKDLIDKAYKMYMVIEMLKYQEEYVYGAGK